MNQAMEYANVWTRNTNRKKLNIEKKIGRRCSHNLGVKEPRHFRKQNSQKKVYLYRGTRAQKKQKRQRYFVVLFSHHLTIKPRERVIRRVSRDCEENVVFYVRPMTPRHVCVNTSDSMHHISKQNVPPPNSWCFYPATLQHIPQRKVYPRKVYPRKVYPEKGIPEKGIPEKGIPEKGIPLAVCPITVKSERRARNPPPPPPAPNYHTCTIVRSSKLEFYVAFKHLLTYMSRGIEGPQLNTGRGRPGQKKKKKSAGRFSLYRTVFRVECFSPPPFRQTARGQRCIGVIFGGRGGVSRA